MSGLKLAALYGLAPHRLGLCGPKEAVRQEILLKFLKGKLSSTQILPVLQKFKGAVPYYRLIARKNRIAAGAFNKKVVEAYWIGNELLDKVTADDLRKMVINNFSGPGLLLKAIAEKKAAIIPDGSKPHHSFHVLTIGSVTGSVDFKNTKLKDLCRVGWGKVIKKLETRNHKSEKIIVKCQPLSGNKKINLGRPIKKEIFWNKEIVPELKIGDWVSFHWNWLVQVLKKDNIENLKKYTLNTLNCLR